MSNKQKGKIVYASGDCKYMPLTIIILISCYIIFNINTCLTYPTFKNKYVLNITI